MFRKTAISLLLTAAVLPALAEVELPALFGHHAVLQRSAATPVFGFAAPGEKIRVEYRGISAETTTGADGRWRVNLDLSQLSAEPGTLKVTGTNTVTSDDVVPGEVWLASGQSNMGFSLNRAENAQSEIAIANPQLRFFKVPPSCSGQPLHRPHGVWQYAGPRNSGGFSAVAYFFGRELQNRLNVPVGMIQSAVGGTPIEAWSAREILESDPEVSKTCARFREIFAAYPAKLEKYLTELDAWEKANQRSDRDGHEVPDGPWKTIRLPGPMPGHGGAVWFRRTFNLERPTRLVRFGTSTDPIEIFYNGDRVLKADRRQLARSPYINVSKTMPAGKCEVQIRVFTSGAPPQILGDPDTWLDGDWAYCYEFELPPVAEARNGLPPSYPGRAPNPMRQPSVLYNAMINPLAPYGLRGVIWYQGESNAGNAAKCNMYAREFQAMIKDWRKRFEQPELPFYFCQLANFRAKQSDPEQTGTWPDLRRAQAAALALPRTGMAVLIDAGEALDIHPINKLVAGQRLAAHALRNEYLVEDIAVNGPIPTGVEVDGDAVVISFQKLHGGLVARPLPETYDLARIRQRKAKLIRNSPDSELEGFALRDADGRWHWANAVITGDMVKVSSPAVSKPTAVRYAWQDNPTCNLYNKAGLPAAPFEREL